MTAPNATPPVDALDAVQQLESALAERTDARGVAEAGIDAARAEAEQLLGDARRTGSDAGRRRRVEILVEAEVEARAIRADAEAEVQELRERVSARHDELIAELTGLVLPEEAASACSSR
jgi:F0F1-type ATP synthase membrane subunit b/b'